MAIDNGWRDRVRQFDFWQAFVLYALFVFSTFTIAGIEQATFVLLIMSIVHYLRHRPVIMPPLWIIAPFVVFTADALLSALINPNVLRNISQMTDVYRFVVPFVLLPALDKVCRRRLLKVYVVMLAVVSLYSVVQFNFGVDWFRPAGEKVIRPFGGTGVFHAAGNFDHHLTYAGFMLVNVPLFVALALTDRGTPRLWWAGGALASIVGVLMSLGRSGWLGALVGVCVLLLMLPRRVWVPSVAIVAAGLIAFGGLLASGHLQRTLGDRPPAIMARLLQTSVVFDRDRLYLWEAGWLAFKDHPWLGVGIGNEDYDYEAYRKIVSARHQGYRFVTTASAGIHNIYLQIAFDMGVVGLAVYLGLFVTLLWWCAHWLRRAGRDFGLERGLLWGAAGALVGFSAASFFNNYFFDDECLNVLMIAFALALHAGLRIRRGQPATGGAPQMA